MDEKSKPVVKKSGKPILLMALLILGSIVAAVLANAWKSDLAISEIVVEGNKVVTTKEVLSLAGIDKKQRLFTVDLFAARKRLEANPFIQSASVNREAPNRIRISVAERQPVAAMVLDRLVYLDADGFVLPPARSEHLFDLPVITGLARSKELAPGKQTVNTDIRDALEILSVAQLIDDELYRKISEVRVERGKDIMLYTAENGVPIVFGRGDTAAKLVKFETFWDEFVAHHGASELQYVDLRYEDQVVVRWNHSPDEQETKEASNKSSTTQDI